MLSCVATVSVLASGCNAETRYRVLSTFFDGVPPPAPAAPVAPQGVAGTSADTRERKIGYREHGPYGARLCTACHVPNNLSEFVAPKEQLCFQCHPLMREKTFVHGPLASGGCLACHDPHSSQYRYLLVSESDDFCFRCHEESVVARIQGHDEQAAQCTVCHDPHMSDKASLLR
jgi:predicted CXXCH cytochrome family protein